VLKDKYTTLPMTVERAFSDIIAKCLQKKPEKRPVIDEIIALEVFQLKAKQLKIKIPPMNANYPAPST
jgi:hypothetical protein